MLLGSLVLHGLLLVFLLKLIPGGQGLKPLEPAYVVNLVSLNDGPAKGVEPVRGPAPDLPAKAIPVSKPPAPPDKPIPLPKPPAPVEKKVALPEESKSLDLALERLKKKMDQGKSLERSFNRIENRVKNQEALAQAMARLEKKGGAKIKRRGRQREADRGGRGLFPQPIRRDRRGPACNFNSTMPA